MISKIFVNIFRARRIKIFLIFILFVFGGLSFVSIFLSYKKCDRMLKSVKFQNSKKVVEENMKPDCEIKECSCDKVIEVPEETVEVPEEIGSPVETVEAKFNCDDCKSKCVHCKENQWKSVLELIGEIYVHCPATKDAALEHVIKWGLYYPEGMVLEFGVYSGKSINFIGNHFAISRPNLTIHGFDSFTGLPEDWRSGFKKGKFSRGGNLPEVTDNVQLHAGLFDETLPDFVEEHQDETISILNVDCDLYSSTKTIFEHLKKNIVVGTVIVFHELLEYPGYKEGEVKAFFELINELNMKFKCVSRRKETVAVKVTSLPTTEKI